MKIHNFCNHFKQWCLRVSVSSIIFVSVMFLGGTIITLAVPSSLNDIKSTNTNNQLTAENRDYLIDQVKVGLSNVASSLRIKNGDNVYYTGMVGIGTTPNNLRSEKLQVDGSGRFSGEVAVVSSLRVGKSQMSPAPKMYIDNTDANYSLYINNQSGTYGLYVIGTGRNYLKGNVGIGTTPSVTYALNVNGTGNFSKPLYAPTPTSSSTNNQVATKGYVDNQSSSQKPTISTHIVSRQTYGQSSIGFSESFHDICFVSGIMTLGPNPHLGNAPATYNSGSFVITSSPYTQIQARKPENKSLYVIVDGTNPGGADDGGGCWVEHGNQTQSTGWILKAIIPNVAGGNGANDTVVCQFTCLKF